MPTYANFGMFDWIRNGNFIDEVKASSDSYSQVNYLPIDNTSERFKNKVTATAPVTYTNVEGDDMYLITGYIQGGEPSSAVVKLDLYVNFETIVHPEARDYLATDVYDGNAPHELASVRSYVTEATTQGKIPKSTIDSRSIPGLKLNEMQPKLREEVAKGDRDIIFKVPETTAHQNQTKKIASSALKGVGNFLQSTGGKILRSVGKALIGAIPGIGKGLSTAISIGENIAVDSMFPKVPEKQFDYNPELPKIIYA
jgi:hypothetical protein